MFMITEVLVNAHCQVCLDVSHGASMSHVLSRLSRQFLYSNTRHHNNNSVTTDAQIVCRHRGGGKPIVIVVGRGVCRTCYWLIDAGRTLLLAAALTFKVLVFYSRLAAAAWQAPGVGRRRSKLNDYKHSSLSDEIGLTRQHPSIIFRRGSKALSEFSS